MCVNWRCQGDILSGVMARSLKYPSKCSVTGCTLPAITRGLCANHYYRWKKYRNPYHQKPTPEERFFRAMIVEKGGCWVWIGKTDKNGYGRFFADGHQIMAHRWAYKQWIGPVSDDKHLDHFYCENPPCVNPSHVRSVTPRENTLRSLSPAAINLAKTHCPQGHLYEGDNLIWQNSKGKISRVCKTCSYARWSKRWKGKPRHRNDPIRQAELREYNRLKMREYRARKKAQSASMAPDKK